MPRSELEIRYTFAVSCNGTFTTTHQPFVEVFAFSESHHLLLKREVCFCNNWASCWLISSELRAWRFLSIAFLIQLFFYFELDFSLLWDTQTSRPSLKRKLERNWFTTSILRYLIGLWYLMSIYTNVRNNTSSFLIEVKMFFSLVPLWLLLIWLFDHLLDELTC